MEIIIETWYVAKDGTKFDSVINCSSYENLIDKVNTIMSKLPVRPDDSDFLIKIGNRFADGYLQHDLSVLNEVKKEFLKLVMEQHPNQAEIITKTLNGIAHESWLRRFLSEYEPIFSRTWWRFSCIDLHGREWQQIYYKDNPDSTVNPTAINMEK